jgi:hypothetical protein
MIRKRVASRFAIAAAVAGVAASFTTPIASADRLSNGLDVTCNTVGDNDFACVISGCPRVNGDYVVDALHVMDNGHQEEFDFKCINGDTIHTSYHIPIASIGSAGYTFGLQACRKKDLQDDWCTPYANYTFHPPAAPAAPAPQAPPPQQQAPKPDVQCPPDSPVKTVPAGQTCPAAPPVTDAISLSFGQPQITLIPPSASITATVSNSSALNGKCTYDANPSNTHRDFNVPPHGSTPLTFTGIATGTTYHAKVTCTDASGKQTQPIGTASQDVRF